MDERKSYVPKTVRIGATILFLATAQIAHPSPVFGQEQSVAAATISKQESEQEKIERFAKLHEQNADFMARSYINYDLLQQQQFALSPVDIQSILEQQKSNPQAQNGETFVESRGLLGSLLVDTFTTYDPSGNINRFQLSILTGSNLSDDEFDSVFRNYFNGNPQWEKTDKINPSEPAIEETGDLYPYDGIQSVADNYGIVSIRVDNPRLNNLTDLFTLGPPLPNHRRS